MDIWHHRWAVRHTFCIAFRFASSSSAFELLSIPLLAFAFVHSTQRPTDSLVESVKVKKRVLTMADRPGQDGMLSPLQIPAAGSTSPDRRTRRARTPGRALTRDERKQDRMRGTSKCVLFQAARPVC